MTRVETASVADAEVRALVPGDPARVSSLANQLGTIAAGLAAAAEALTVIGVDHWRGPAATAFLGALGTAPGPLRAGGEAFGAAATAVRGHAGALEQAQSMARAALAAAEEGRAATAVWASRSQERAAVASKAAAGDAGAMAQLASMPPPGADPGQLARQRGERLLAEARERVSTSGRQVAAVLAGAGASAPREPNLAVKALVRGAQLQRQVAFGAGEVFLDVGALGLRTTSARLVVNPHGWMQDAGAVTKDLATTALAPGAGVASMLDLGTWAKNPARAVGHLGGNALVGLAAGGDSAASESGLISRLRPAELFRKPANRPISLPIRSFAKTDPLAEYAQNIPRLDGHYDVAAHGNQLEVEIHLDEGPSTLRAPDLARLIAAQPDYHGQPVRLVSCFTGERPDGIAQQLANELGVQVVAPSSKLWVWDDGRTAVGLDWQVPDGRWLTYKPGGPQG